MKALITCLILHTSLLCRGQENQTDFGLYFGNDFKNDSVTIIANNVLIARNIQLRETMYIPENLMIDQTGNKLTVRPKKGNHKVFHKINVHNSKLDLQIKMNNTDYSFSFDLRKGNFLYARYIVLRGGWSAIRMLVIEQNSSPCLIF